ncbi:MAG: D-tyrosyl-tRNA(Tyr) deacylase [Bryobacteraceae bacterium]|jgi:D-tyrosyl-tRNA(Tyr) deacylase|nr:D-tyrosyl-tRNA(Tyr) deacylase [Bryobacteraceae bacterium]
MRAVLQRVSEARVEVAGEVTGAIGSGLVVFVGISREDTRTDAEYLAEKITGLRVFPDETGKMNRDVKEAGGSILIVSQFTLYADARKGRRPGFDRAAPPDSARPLYDYFVEAVRRRGVPVATGIFQAVMSVRLINDGPVTILLDSEKTI